MSEGVEEDPFWVCAMMGPGSELRGAELLAREELVPDREQDEVMAAALALRLGPHTAKTKKRHAETSSWLPAEVRVKQVSIRGLVSSISSARNSEDGSGTSGSTGRSSGASSGGRWTNDGVLSVTGGELWPAALILAQLLVGASWERPSSFSIPSLLSAQERSSKESYRHDDDDDDDDDDAISGKKRDVFEGGENKHDKEDDDYGDDDYGGNERLEESSDSSLRFTPRGSSVLELGAGLGLLGLVAARVGARAVCLSDVVPALCANLQDTVAINEASHGAFVGAVGGAREGVSGGGGAMLLGGSSGKGKEDSVTEAAHNRECEDGDGDPDYGGAKDDDGDDNDDDASSVVVPESRPIVMPLDWCDWLTNDLDNDQGHDEEDAHKVETIEACADGGETGKNARGGSPPLPLPRTHLPLDLILGSELVYAPHHADALAAFLAHAILTPPQLPPPPSPAPQPPAQPTPATALLARAQAPPPSSPPLPPRPRLPRCVIVQREDRPGWSRFLDRLGSLGLGASVVPLQQVADAATAAVTAAAAAAADPADVTSSSKTPIECISAPEQHEKSPRGQMETATFRDSCGRKEGGATNGESCHSGSAGTSSKESSGGGTSLHENCPLGQPGLDLSPFVICEIYSSREAEEINRKELGRGKALLVSGTNHIKTSSSLDNGGHPPVWWPSLVRTYLMNLAKVVKSLDRR